MKVINLFILILITVSCNSLNKKDEISKKRAVICGKIASTNINVINLSFQDVFLENNSYTQIKDIDNSSFHFEFEIANETEVFLSLGDKTINLLVTPKDSVNVIIEPSFFKDDSKISEKHINISGSNKILNNVNNEIFEYKRRHKSHRNWIDPSKNSIDSLFSKIEKLYNNQITKLENYSKIHESSREFIEWKKNSLKYSFAKNLTFYHIYLTSNGIKKNNKLFNYEFFNNPDIKALNTHNYLLHIRNSTPQKYCYYEQKFSDYFAEKKYKKAFNYSIDLVLSQEPNSMIRDIVMMRLLIMFNSISTVDFNEIWERKDEILNNQIFIEEIENRIINPKKKESNVLLKSSTSQTNEENIKNFIIKTSNNKVVYLDIWATWCGPCLAEIPSLLELNNKVNNDETIKIIGVCLSSDKQKWNELLKDNNLPGSQYFLNKEESMLFKKQFPFTGFPTYMIIKNGVILNNNAPKPSEKNKVLKELENAI